MGTDAFCIGRYKTYVPGVMQGFIPPVGHTSGPEVDAEAAVPFLLSLAKTPGTQRRHRPHKALKGIARASC